MLIQVTYSNRGGVAEQEQALAMFERWQPPTGVEIKGHYTRADGGGFAIVEADSAEAILIALAPWASTLLDYQVTPIVEIEQGVAALKQGIAFRNA